MYFAPIATKNLPLYNFRGASKGPYRLGALDVVLSPTYARFATVKYQYSTSAISIITAMTNIWRSRGEDQGTRSCRSLRYFIEIFTVSSNCADLHHGIYIKMPSICNETFYFFPLPRFCYIIFICIILSQVAASG